MFLFEIIGSPVPQEQTRVSNGRFYDPSASHKKAIQWQMRPYAPSEVIQGPVQVDITFYFEPPKSTSKVRRKQMLNQVIHHVKRPDLDNCAYLITNAMKELVYHDDSQIIDLGIHKRYGERTKTVVRVLPIEQIIQTRGEECL